MDILAAETGLRLKGVEDIIKHYDEIFRYVDNLESLDEEKYADISEFNYKWPWDSKWNFRVLDHNGEKIIIFKKKWQPLSSYSYYF